MRLAALLIALWASTAAADIFSPGELAQAHHALEGLSNCTQCHPAGQQLSQETCLDCHTELKPRIAKGVGFHGKIKSELRECENCHKEHQGRDFPLIDWGKGGKKGFDHRQTGWALQGKHSPLACEKCHEPRLVFANVIKALLEKKPARQTFLGLSTECTACHFDEHRGQTEGECTTCHSEAAWKQTPHFNHAETHYPLEGKHQKVACAKCHPSVKDNGPMPAFPAPVSETFMKFAPIEHRGCTDCHDDAHDGKFGARCTSCHTTQGWKNIRGTMQERAFHEQTRYPLKGAHLDAPCRSCHGPFPGQPARFKNMAFSQCTDCHADAHQGQLSGTAKNKAPDCATCHMVEGFLPVQFSMEAHQRTRYPLEGAHQTIPCSSCHPPTAGLLARVPAAIRMALKKKNRLPLFSTAVFDFTKPLAQCESCHQDVHKGQFSKAGTACASCHQVSSFHALTFDHQKTRFPLEGAHQTVACGDCHGPASKGGLPRYKPLPLNCAGCHADEHAGQFDSADEKTPCQRCHGNTEFKPASAFVHQPPFTTYLLEGKHAKVACDACHPRVAVGPGLTVQRFRGVPQTCEGCHSDFHRGEFKDFEP